MFKDTSIDNDTFDAVAGLLAQVPAVVSKVDPASSPMLLRQSDSPTQATTAAVKNFSSHTDASWMDGASTIIQSVGDFLEGVWHGIETVAKFGIKVVADVLNFFAEIRGKVFRFVLDSIGTVIRR